jgi:hypothetical protein
MPTYKPTLDLSPFPHHRDAAFRLLGNLQARAAQITPIRGTSVLRSSLQRAIVRLAQSLVRAAHGITPQRAERVHAVALEACREIEGAAYLLRRATVLTATEYRELVLPCARIERMLRERYRCATEQLEEQDAPETEPAVGTVVETGDPTAARFVVAEQQLATPPPTQMHPSENGREPKS